MRLNILNLRLCTDNLTQHTHMSHDTVTLQNVCYEIYFISISPWLESKCKCNDLNAKPCNISHSDIKIQAWFLLLKNKAQFNGF